MNLTKIENRVIREGVLGKERYFILSSEIYLGDKNVSLYLMNPMDGKQNYSLWFGEIMDNGAIDFWSYKGAHFEEIKKRLLVYYLEHSLDDFSEGENQRQQGEKVLKADHYVKVAEYLSKVAEQGDATTKNNLGLLYYNGWGVPQDYAKAAEWFHKAAEQGHDEAKDYLAKMESEQ
jgi:TPR repeat protein